MVSFYFLGVAMIAACCVLNVSIKNAFPAEKSFLFLGIFFMSYFFSLRMIDAGSDTIFYYSAFSFFKGVDLSELSISALSYGYISQEKLFSLLTFFLSRFLDFDGYLFTVSFISILASSIYYEKVIGRNYYFVFLIFICGTTAIYLFGNTIRQGLSLPLAFLASWYYFYGHKKLGVCIFIACIFVH